MSVDINNVVPGNTDNMPDPMTYSSVGAGPSFASIGFNYVTREEIEEMLDICR